MNVNLSGQHGDLIMVIWLLIVIATLVVHAAFAWAVLMDAAILVDAGRRPVFVGPFIWALATLLGGVFVATAYWAMHHSTLQRWSSPQQAADPPDPSA